MALNARIEINQAEWRRLFESPTGEVAEDLKARARQIERSARRRAPKDTGELKASIDMVTGSDTEGLYADIGSREFYAPFVELGHVAQDGTRVSPRKFLRPALRAGRRVRQTKKFG